MEIVFVCTANVNRSVMAESMAARLIEKYELDVAVSSASILDRPDHPSPEETLTVLRNWGIDARAHRSRTLDEMISAQADVVLTMERAHLPAAATLGPGAFDKTYTLREFVRLGLQNGPREPDEPLGEYLERLSAERDPATLLADEASDDVTDPQGGSFDDFAKAAKEIDLLVRGAFYLLFRCI